MELISREDFRDRMYHEAFEVDSELQKWDSGCWVRYKLFEKILDEMPTVESRPKGEWIDFTCSECGFTPLIKPMELNVSKGFMKCTYKYCPDCGSYNVHDLEKGAE